MPFITEEIWHALSKGNPPARSIALTRFPQESDFESDEGAESQMQLLQSLIVEIRAIRKEIGVPEKEIVRVGVHASEEVRDIVTRNLPIVQRMARVSQIGYTEVPIPGIVSHSTGQFDVAVLYKRTIDIPAERERLTRDLAKYEKGLASAERQLSNDAFLAKAPAHILEGLRKQAAETRTLYEKTKVALDALPAS
jgi:valyl-tRNA synthetase